ncbi:MAG TPA: hypothetical protein PK867_29780, partial [Pirellulales bacterium]|nr:hypothetical protein [Pirellulales bacterium]
MNFDATGEAAPPSSPESKFRLFIYVSSKGPYFGTKLFALRAIGGDHLEYGLPSPGDYWIEVKSREGLP